MPYDIHVLNENITGINVDYNKIKILYIIDTCNVHLFTSQKYSWKHKNSGDNTEPILYYPVKVDGSVKHIQYKRLITHTDEDVCVSTINNNYYDLRYNNLIRHPRGKTHRKDKLINDYKHLLFPYELNFKKLKLQIEQSTSCQNALSLHSEYKISFDPFDKYTVITDINTLNSIIFNGNISKEMKEDLTTLFNIKDFKKTDI